MFDFVDDQNNNYAWNDTYLKPQMNYEFQICNRPRLYTQLSRLLHLTEFHVRDYYKI